jgi:hypothetical protein
VHFAASKGFYVTPKHSGIRTSLIVTIMKLLPILSSLACIAAVVHGLNSKNTKQFESLKAVPTGWQSIGLPEPTTRMAFKIALKLVCFFRFLQ